MIDIAALDFEKGRGLIPVVVQDADTLQVLTLAYTNRTTLAETIDSQEATFFSRSRNSRWRKGEISGDRLRVVSIIPDCDGDALLLQVRPRGDACHLQRPSCFGEQDAPGLGRLARLEQTIEKRAKTGASESWTAHLLAGGPKRVAQKVGEEGIETALAGAAGSPDELASEAADLLYHLLVLLHSRDLRLADALRVLEGRAQRRAEENGAPLAADRTRRQHHPDQRGTLRTAFSD